jgi:hypothetical protein
MLRRRATFVGKRRRGREGLVTENVYEAGYLYVFIGENFGSLSNWTAKLDVRKLPRATQLVSVDRS